jgi:hypothetical protein
MRLLRFTAAGLLLSMAACGGEDEPAPAASAAAFQPMRDGGYRVEWGVPSVPCSLKTGVSVPVSVVVKNVGDQRWPDVPASDQGMGRGAVRLCYRWWKAGNDKVPAIDYGRPRGDLKAPLEPGNQATLTVTVDAPPTPGDYILQLELVAELVHWFQDRGAARLMVPVTVS